MIIRYNKNALKAAAKHIWKNNPSVHRWPDAPTSKEGVEERIKADMYRYAQYNIRSILAGTADTDWQKVVGTGGYFFVFSSDDDNEIDVDILIQPTYDHKFIDEPYEIRD